MKLDRSEKFLRAAAKVMPGGANSNVRCRNVMGVSHGAGAELVDLDGNAYIDYVLGFGPILLGHAHHGVKQAVARAMEKGTTFSYTTESEYNLCGEIVSLCPSVEMVRLCNSGTDAAVSAFRIASTYTGGKKAVKIQGDYNGGFDLLAFDVPGVDASGFRRGPKPVGTGFLEGVQDLIHTIPFNNADELERVFKQNRNEIAAVFMEPVLGNVASIMPLSGYLKMVKEMCAHYGAVLVFDEVKTGFRVALGGAQELFDIHADISMFGKAIANGLPLAAVGGKKELMELAAPEKAFHCGSYYGNLPVAEAAIAVLSNLKKKDYHSINRLGAKLARGVCRILEKNGVPARWQGPGAMFGVTIGDEAPVDYTSWWLNTDRRKWMSVSSRMRDMGVLSDDFIGLFFLSFAHTDAHIQKTLEICETAVKRTINSPTLYSI